MGKKENFCKIPVVLDFNLAEISLLLFPITLAFILLLYGIFYV